jgi:hypothetical protein
MVYVFGALLPKVIKDQFNLPSEDQLNPKNYIKYSEIVKAV